MKFVLILLVIVGVSCNQGLKNHSQLTCFVSEDSLFFYDGNLDSNSKFEILGNLEDDSFLKKIKERLKSFNSTNKNDSIFIKPIQYNVITFNKAFNLLSLLKADQVKNLIYSQKFSEGESRYYNFDNIDPFHLPTILNIMLPSNKIGGQEIINKIMVKISDTNYDFRFKDSDLFIIKLNEIELKKDTLSEWMNLRLQNEENKIIIVQANDEVPYKYIIKLMEFSKKNGYKMAINTQGNK